MRVKRYEYKIVPRTVGGRLLTTEGEEFRFNEIGKDGWLFCNSDNDGNYVFARTKYKRVKK